MKGQLTLAPHKDKLMQLIGVERTPIYRLSQTSLEWAGEQLNYDHIRQWCRFNNIPVPSLKESNSSAGAILRRKQTFLNNYGVDNPSKSSAIQSKKDQTNLARHGVNNPFQRKDIQIKIEQTLMDKYGVSNARYLPRHYDHGTGRLTAPHKKVSAYLQEISIVHYNEQPNLFPKPRAKNNRIYSPIVDIWIPDINLVVEIYGDRWHANPRTYLANDILPLWDGDLTAQQIWDRDSQRINHIKSFGADVHVIWESEINKTLDIVKDQLYRIIQDKGSIK
jgi:very-short-patch-repair endonuclease